LATGSASWRASPTRFGINSIFKFVVRGWTSDFCYAKMCNYNLKYEDDLISDPKMVELNNAQL
jgi:hypothetical protein